MSIPHRHDLPNLSSVNTEIHKINRKLHKLCKRFHNVRIVNITVDRSGHTNHDMHLNKRGKILVARLIAKVIAQVPQTSIIPLPYVSSIIGLKIQKMTNLLEI